MNARRCLGGLAMLVLIVPSPAARAQHHGGTHAHHSNPQTLECNITPGAGPGPAHRPVGGLGAVSGGFGLGYGISRITRRPGRMGCSRMCPRFCSWGRAGLPGMPGFVPVPVADRPRAGGATASAGIRRRGCCRSSSEQDEAKRSSAGCSAHDHGRPALSRGQSQEGRGTLSASGQARQRTRPRLGFGWRRSPWFASSTPRPPTGFARPRPLSPAGS